MTNVIIGLIDSAFVLIPLVMVLVWVTWAILSRIWQQRKPINPETEHRSFH